MASITIRDLEDDVKIRLLERAAEHHRSIEEEARMILRDAVACKPPSQDLASAFLQRFGPTNGIDLELPPREPVREPPSFD